MDVADILSYNAELANYVLDNPTESLPLVHSLSLDISARRPIFLASHYEGIEISDKCCTAACMWQPGKLTSLCMYMCAAGGGGQCAAQEADAQPGGGR